MRKRASESKCQFNPQCHSCTEFEVLGKLFTPWYLLSLGKQDGVLSGTYAMLLGANTAQHSHYAPDNHQASHI